MLFSSYSLGENKSLYSDNILPLKLINHIKKYPHIIESYDCILQTFVVIFLLPTIFLISFGMYSTPKLSKYIALSPKYTVLS